MSKIVGDMAGCYSPLGKTFILTDEEGTEIIGVVTDQEQVFSASVADVKIGKTFASDEGVQTGEDTKTYRTTHASRCVLPNESFSIPLEKYNQYDYTNFQAVIAPLVTDEFDSLAVEKSVLFDGVYNAGSSVKVSDVTKNSDTKTVELNIVNNTDNTFVINYSTYKEEYA